MDKEYGVKLAYYESLLENSYAEAVAQLKEKYGMVEDDYFREKSYERFLNGKIKFPEKGNFSKTALGLYCHHINENHHEHLADLEWIKKISILLRTPAKRTTSLLRSIRTLAFAGVNHERNW